MIFTFSDTKLVALMDAFNDPYNTLAETDYAYTQLIHYLTTVFSELYAEKRELDAHHANNPAEEHLWQYAYDALYRKIAYYEPIWEDNFGYDELIW